MGPDFVCVEVASLSQERPGHHQNPRLSAHWTSEVLAQNSAKKGAVDIAATQRCAHFQTFQLVFL